jgi:ribosomal protein S13
MDITLVLTEKQLNLLSSLVHDYGADIHSDLQRVVGDAIEHRKRMQDIEGLRCTDRLHYWDPPPNHTRSLI